MICCTEPGLTETMYMLYIRTDLLLLTMIQANDISHQRKRPTSRNLKLSDRNKDLVLSPTWMLYTKTDWPTDVGLDITLILTWVLPWISCLYTWIIKFPFNTEHSLKMILCDRKVSVFNSHQYKEMNWMYSDDDLCLVLFYYEFSHARITGTILKIIRSNFIIMT
jgi:hypothetical protein